MIEIRSKFLAEQDSEEAILEKSSSDAAKVEEPEIVKPTSSKRPINKRTLFGVLGVAIGIIFLLVVFSDPSQQKKWQVLYLCFIYSLKNLAITLI